MSVLLLITQLLASLICISVVSLWNRQRRLLKLMPPSPPGLPLLGNVLQVPQVEPWHTFGKWKQQYGKFSTGAVSTHTDVFTGPVFSFSMMGKYFVVLNTVESANELLGKYPIHLVHEGKELWLVMQTAVRLYTAIVQE